MKLIAEMDGTRFRVETLRVDPGDRIVFSAMTPISADAAAQIRSRAKELFPDNEVVVLQGMKIAVQESAA